MAETVESVEADLEAAAEELRAAGVSEVDHEVDNEQATEELALLALLLWRRRVDADLYERLGGLARVKDRGRTLSGRAADARDVVIRRVQRWGGEAIGEVEAEVTRGLRRLARIEAEYQLRKARDSRAPDAPKPVADPPEPAKPAPKPDSKAAPKPGPLSTAEARKLGRVVPVMGRDLAEAFRKLAEGFGDRAAEIIRMGIERGDTIDAIIDAVTGNADALTVKAERDIRRVIVTARTSATAGTRLKLAETWPEVWDRIQHVSVLDSRTSAICVERSGKVYKAGTVFPVPPLHWNCRSSLRLIRAGEEPADLPTGDAYLKAVGKTRQNEVLGRKGAEAWRNGSPVSRLVTPALAPISQAELRRRNRRRAT